jgi:hypothetical protein
MKGADAEVTAYIGRWRPSSVSAEAAVFARDVIRQAAPGGQERAKNLLRAAGKLADYAIGLGLQPVPEVVLHPSVAERFTRCAPGLSGVARRTLRTNLRSTGELSQVLGVVQGVFTEAGQDRLALDNLAYRPRARGQDGRLLDEVSVRVDGAGEQGRLATRWRLRVILAVLAYEDVADLAEIVDTAEHHMAPDLAGPRQAEFPARFPRHRIPWAEVDDMFLGINRGQLLRAEHLHGVPETYNPRRIIRHAHHHPGV